MANRENCLDVESAEKLQECRGDQTALSMKQVWMNLHPLRSRIVSEVPTHERPSSGPISARLILEEVLGKEPDFLQSDGADHVHDNTVSSVSRSFPRASVERQRIASLDRLLEARARYQIVYV